MIIKCEQCQTRFKLDDSKVTAKGVKVRCAKCRHVFSVRKEEPEPEALDLKTPPVPAVVADQPELADSVKSAVPEAQEPAPQFSFDDDSTAGDIDHSDDPESSWFGELPSDSATEAIKEEQLSSSTLVEEQTFAVNEDQKPLSQEVAAFGDVDFGDFGAESDSALSAPPTMEPVDKEEPQQPDFSDDDMFGAVVSPVAEDPGDATSFDFGTDSFADSMDTVGSNSGQKESSTLFDTTGDEPFSLGEIDFGDELTAVAVQQVNPEKLKPSQEILFAPLAAAQEKPAEEDDQKKSFSAEMAAAQEELPPLSITSRRKQNSFFAGLIAVVALLVVGVLGYFGYTSFMPDRGAATQESGKISVRAVKATFVQNATIGPLLVLSGEALNEFPKSRAALQVKGTVFGAAGQVLATKVAYCGNPLTAEQLGNLPQDKIETAMANQFGDSLSNLEVAAGKAVPFTIVIANPPGDSKDFAVEPAGSTVATSKQ